MNVSPTVNYLKSTSREFSLYVNDSRAIPFIGDGLKHVQRVALWVMRNEPDKVKVVGLVGRLADMGLYVHGDVACAAAISLLAAPYCNNIMLLQGDGQFGSRTAIKDGIGSPRYVSVKRSPAAQAFLYTDADIVPLENNYDDSNQQPIHFLPLIPTVLLNGISGIGVGYSTEILPRKLSDVIAATQKALKGQKPSRLVPHYERYDVTVKETAQNNQWMITGKASIVDTSTVKITELPPGMPLEDFRARLIELEDTDQIVRFVDNSTESISITVTFKRGTIASWKEKDAISFFKLSEKTTERIVVRDWTGNKIVQYPDAETVVVDFVKWRLAWYTNRYEKMLADTSYELTYWQILRALFKDGFTKRLGTFANRDAIEADVMKVAEKAKIPFEKKQMDRVVSLPTYRWTKEFEAEVGAKIAALEADIKEQTAILKSPDRLKGIYSDELDLLKKKF